MATQTYEIRVDGELRATFSTDFAQASSPILMSGSGTPFQVADARHSVEQTCDLLIAWGDNQGCPIVADGETYEWSEVEDESVEDEAECPF